MFCYQCEQTSKGEGCRAIGVCGKDENTAAMQDLLLLALKGLSVHAHAARQLGVVDEALDAFTIRALFATLTNVNFDAEGLADLTREAVEWREAARVMSRGAAHKDIPSSLLEWRPSATMEGLLEQARPALLTERFLREGRVVVDLKELVLYGVKGVAAYAYHAMALGAKPPVAEIHQTLELLSRAQVEAGELLSAALAIGELNYRVMELLDAAHTSRYGHPTPTRVRVEPRKGKAILVSGHDLHDLEALLQQTEGLGVNVYTHGEMLPAHGYPELRKYAHLAGNYGGAWMDQGEEFSRFPGAILMTSNCIQQPKKAYVERIFTAGAVAWPGVRHIADSDFAPVIAAALAAPGFAEDGGDKQITVGFGRKAVLDAADLVVDAVKSGAIRRFFLIGGCDGARSGRDYYTQLAEKIPQDCMILTLACGKYRFNKLEFGEIGGLPRLLDVGQCNDAYSALQIALALAKAFDCGVNDLPLSLVLSWYEQKAVAVLLTLLHLGVRNIRIGPTLPAFLSPSTLAFLQEKFNLMAIGSADEDLSAMLA